MDYYSPFWGPRAITTIDDPQVEFKCPSSTLKVLANSDPFSGLLLTVFGSQSDLLVEPQGALTCRSSIILGLSDSELFNGLLLTVSRFRSDFHE